MSKLIEVAPQTITVQNVLLVFGRHAGDDGAVEEGTAFLQVSVSEKDAEGMEVVNGSTVCFNDDGTVHSEVEHAPPVPLENPPDPQKAKDLEETTM